MKGKEVKLVIVADLGLVKAYRLGWTPKGTPHLDLLEQVILEEAHHRVVDKVTDLAGRRGSPTQRNWGAPLADAHNLRLENQRRLTKEIARHIERLAHAHEEMPVRLAAHKEINHLVLDALPKGVRQRIQVNLSRDLVKASKQELLQCFAPEEQAGRSKQSGRAPGDPETALSTKTA